MRRWNVKYRVVLGLVGLTVSLFMLAFLIGIVPDRESAVREGRAALAEAIAVHSTAAVMANNVQRLEADFKLLAERNADLLSLGLRREDGRALVLTEGHADHWLEMSGEYSKGHAKRGFPYGPPEIANGGSWNCVSKHSMKAVSEG